MVGGESGIGKSRLLDELRTQAFIKGFRVLQGQGIEEGGFSYQLWREPLRRLALYTPISDLEASIIRPIVPNLETLLGRSVSDPPDLTGGSPQRRLQLTIAEIIQRPAANKNPIILLLEDLHWTDESLEPLKPLIQAAKQIPLLIIATFRNDERPDLDQQLPGAEQLTLHRLEEKGVEALSVSMLGKAGANPEIVQLLHQESEGNIYFLVETVRSLADLAGNLENVGQMNLPNSIVAGGIRQIVQRRLAKIPAPYRPLLKLAAVAGRAIDTVLLETLSPTINLEMCLSTCANLAVLEVVRDKWRFSHDKLREGILLELDQQALSELHYQVATALTQIYPDDSIAGALTNHWLEAGYRAKAGYYARLAGEQAVAELAHHEAVRFFTKAISLTEPSDLENLYTLLLAREQVYDFLSDRQAQKQDLDQLAILASKLGKDAEATVALRSSRYAFVVPNDYLLAIELAQQAIEYARLTDNKSVEISALVEQGRCFNRMHKDEQAIHPLSCALSLAQQINQPDLEAHTLQVFGTVYSSCRDYDAARKYLDQALHIVQNMHDRCAEGRVNKSLGVCAHEQLNYDEAWYYNHQALEICREVGDQLYEAIVLLNLRLLCHDQQKHEKALAFAQQVIEISGKINDPGLEGYGLIGLADAHFALGDFELAQDGYLSILNGNVSNFNQSLLAEAQSGLACIFIYQGNISLAHSLVDQIVETWDRRGNLNGAEYPLQILFTCYQVLTRVQHSRAGEFLDLAHKHLHLEAEKFTTSSRRYFFLTTIPLHQKILETWQAANKLGSEISLGHNQTHP
ncbi:MAG: tetratricopeptide repeat protein [Chloroflexota bacterium]